jgi:hypothetical protein
MDHDTCGSGARWCARADAVFDVRRAHPRRHHSVGAARHLGVDWHTAWNAIEVEAKTRVGQTERLARVKTLGVDEHICGRPKWERIER